MKTFIMDKYHKSKVNLEVKRPVTAWRIYPEGWQ